MENKILFNLTFIGSGISSTFTLYNTLKKLEKKEHGDTIRIAVVEKFESFHTGIPYGERSGSTTLLITSLKNFLPEPELSEFIDWLNENKQWLLKEFKEQGGPLSLEWTQKHHNDLENNQWEELFIPRRFFGYYIDNKLTALVKKLEKQKKVSVSYIRGKVIDLNQDNGLWEIHIQDQPPILAMKTILAIGSLPSNYLWKSKKRIKKDNFLLINDPYKPRLSETIDSIKKFAVESKQDINVAIVGANASGLEMLYQLNDHPNIKEHINHFYMVSTQGILPDSRIDHKKLQQFQTVHLDGLKNKNSLTASEIAEAVYQDLDLADNIKLGAYSTVGVVSQKFGSLLEKLNREELEIFACHYGNQIGRRQRCAGEHYADVATVLKKRKRFTHIAGRFSDIVPKSSGYELVYTDKNNTPQNVELPIHVVINCISGITLSHPNNPKLISNLISKYIIRANESGIGMQVNKRFEAAENLHIIGPLLAGNVIEGKAVWHVEHCGRIIAFSKMLSNFLIDTEEDVELDIIELDKAEGINAYDHLIKTKWNNNPYYVYDYLSHHKSKNNKILAFNFKVNGVSTIVMPMILREIEISKDSLYDIISPYGYNGPLFAKGTKESIIKKFWEHVDQWYAKNNVVSEFVRFHLNANHQGYSGEAIPTLNNVFGTLMNNFDNQWDSFVSKVRNNYRKAVKEGLSIKFHKGATIQYHHIGMFYDIYVSTMKRNGASKMLYFSLKHFENLILKNKESFTIALVYKDDIAISTELIIHFDNNLFAYLGGTLSDYFNCRPNDYLRVEVIRWGIENAKSHYILGGGITNGDGLYKFKKSLFPDSTDRVFYTGRKIINKAKYDELCTLVFRGNCKNELNTFFPLYRINPSV
ncbi:GNAT family N-acetyltransferase [Croceivirga radicis]|uniref:GNAT family N-acetyltransferase n=1 Tax=Croceivirga radicis TaxID=1929488 RepID=UPI00178C67E1|nr:GNAT family N-acetyltransferase [Croceivirga radicis]